MVLADINIIGLDLYLFQFRDHKILNMKYFMVSAKFHSQKLEREHIYIFLKSYLSVWPEVAFVVIVCFEH